MPAVDRRIGLLLALFLVLLAVAGARAAQLGGLRGGDLRRAADTQQVVTQALPAARGAITDRHGVQLAVSEPAADVSATPYLVRDPQDAARRLAPLIGRAQGRVLEALARRDTGFAYLARGVPAAEARNVEQLAIAGIDVTPTRRRVYPQGALASQLIGTVGVDGQGLFGIEHGHDRTLRGRDGRRRIVRDALGDPIDVEDVARERPGRDLSLTIDVAVQDRVEQVLQEVGERFRPKGSTAVVMDPHNGDVLALANWPRVDANDIGSAPAYARDNRAVGHVYEPGSTFKAFTVAGALQDGAVTPETSFDLPPTLEVADREIREAHERGAVTLSVREILAQSSNVGTVKVGLALGAERFDRWVRRFGFDAPTGIGLPGEAEGLVPGVERYSGASMGNLPIGQGLAVTPMQMAAAYAAIANGGLRVTPRVVRAVDGRRVAPRRGRRVISAETAARVREMLEGVLAPGGTASEVSIDGYRLAGKTGTAEKVDPRTGLYSKTKYVASFVGFAPARDPRLLVAVMVDEPQGEIYGGVVAAPAVQAIMEFGLPYLKIAPTD